MSKTLNSQPLDITSICFKIVSIEPTMNSKHKLTHLQSMGGIEGHINDQALKHQPSKP